METAGGGQNKPIKRSPAPASRPPKAPKPPPKVKAVKPKAVKPPPLPQGAKPQRAAGAVKPKVKPAPRAAAVVASRPAAVGGNGGNGAGGLASLVRGLVPENVSSRKAAEKQKRQQNRGWCVGSGGVVSFVGLLCRVVKHTQYLLVRLFLGS